MRVPQFLESALKPSFFKSCLLLSKSYCLQKYCFYIRGRPDRILLLQTPSLWPGYGTETKPTQFTASAGQNSSPAFSSRDLRDASFPARARTGQQPGLCPSGLQGTDPGSALLLQPRRPLQGSLAPQAEPYPHPRPVSALPSQPANGIINNCLVPTEMSLFQ